MKKKWGGGDEKTNKEREIGSTGDERKNRRRRKGSKQGKMDGGRHNRETQVNPRQLNRYITGVEITKPRRGPTDEDGEGVATRSRLLGRVRVSGAARVFVRPSRRPDGF